MPRRSQRLIAREEEVFDPCVNMVCSIESENIDKRIPQSYKEAMASENADEWMLACMEEMSSLQVNDVFELVPPSEVKSLSTRWVFALKTDGNVAIIKYKARFCVRGFSQVAGVDYFETFSPMLKNKSVRILLSMANKNGWDVHQLDVKTAYLHSPIGDEAIIHVYPPEGFRSIEHPKYIWKLKKALYGLKQSARKWWITMHTFLEKLGFDPYDCDPCIFMADLDGIKIYIGLYVDDVQATGGCNRKIIWLKKELGMKFDMKDMGLVGYLLGWTASYNEQGNKVTHH
jgi:hypothetical protein